jgi:hypothetical protein
VRPCALRVRHGDFPPYAANGAMLCLLCQNYVRFIHLTRRHVRCGSKFDPMPQVIVTVNA